MDMNKERAKAIVHLCHFTAYEIDEDANIISHRAALRILDRLSEIEDIARLWLKDEEGEDVNKD